jgi:hypothetical protein
VAAFDGVCDIRRVGVEPDGNAQLDLKAVDGTFDWTFFLSEKNLSREILAVGLSAIASNKRVAVQMGDTVSWSRIYRCLIVA